VQFPSSESDNAEARDSGVDNRCALQYNNQSNPGSIPDISAGELGDTRITWKPREFSGINFDSSAPII
jgi:hypothetical protein